MKKEGVSTFKVAATYIGTIVGAGFATGQEVLQFFTRFGAWGLAGLIAITFLFIIFGFIIMDLGKELGAKSHLEIIKHSCGKYVGTIIDYIITFFLFGGLTAMLAGAGALLQQQFNLPGMIGVIVMGIITAATVLKGIHGVIDSISFIVPFLLISVAGVCLYSIINSPPDVTASVHAQNQSQLISNWVFAAILYVSYNTVLSIAVLGPLGAQTRHKKAVRYGACWAV